MDKLVENLAEYAHESWSVWVEYLFDHGKVNSDGTFTIDADKVERWQRQMATPYCNLPEKEKNSDREEALKIISVYLRSLYLKE